MVGNLELGTDFEVDNLEACTETVVVLEVYIETGVDLKVCIESRVDLEVCTVLEVAPKVVIDYLEVAP